MGRILSCTRSLTSSYTFFVGSETAGACRSAYVFNDIGAPATFISLWQTVHFASSVSLTPHHASLVGATVPPAAWPDTPGAAPTGVAPGAALAAVSGVILVAGAADPAIATAAPVTLPIPAPAAPAFGVAATPGRVGPPDVVVTVAFAPSPQAGKNKVNANMQLPS